MTNFTTFKILLLLKCDSDKSDKGNYMACKSNIARESTP